VAARRGGGARAELVRARGLRRGGLRALPPHRAARARGTGQGRDELGARAELRAHLTMTDAGRYVVGVAGLAVYRTWLVGDPARCEARMADLRRLVAEPPSLPLAAPELEVVEGYARWAPGPRGSAPPPTPLAGLEGPVAHALLDPVRGGAALEGGGGRGRHTRRLHARGHRVIGVDVSPAMLERARRTVPDAELHVG